MSNLELRKDLEIISGWIKPGSRVLDLGCGGGKLMAKLQASRAVTGYGLELNPDKARECIQRGVNVIHTDLNQGLTDFDEGSFDYVLMTQALQVVEHPDKLLQEMLKVGREGIVTFPNFGNWRTRASLLGGRMPVTKALPNTWYNTPNIHLCTVDDFEALCGDLNIKITRRLVLNSQHHDSIRTRLMPNLMGEVAMYQIKRGHSSD